jgi:hypothetical protein
MSFQCATSNLGGSESKHGMYRQTPSKAPDLEIEFESKVLAFALHVVFIYVWRVIVIVKTKNSNNAACMYM